MDIAPPSATVKRDGKHVELLTEEITGRGYFNR